MYVYMYTYIYIYIYMSLQQFKSSKVGSMFENLSMQSTISKKVKEEKLDDNIQ